MIRFRIRERGYVSKHAMSEMNTKFKAFFGQLLGGAAVLAFLGIGLMIFIKDATVTVWQSPDEPTMYQIQGKDGRDLSLIFTPGNYVYLHYVSSKSNYQESAITRMRGSRGDRLVWRLWKLSGPGQSSIFDWRIYDAGIEPYTMQIDYLNKDPGDSQASVFPKEGDSTVSTLLFGSDRVKFEGMWLVERPVDPALLSSLRSTLDSR